MPDWLATLFWSLVIVFVLVLDVADDVLRVIAPAAVAVLVARSLGL